MQELNRHIHPAYLLVALWVLLFLKASIVLTPLMFSYGYNLALTLLFMAVMAWTIVAIGRPVRETLYAATWVVPLVAGTMILLGFLRQAEVFPIFDYRFDSGAAIITVSAIVAAVMAGWLARRGAATQLRRLLLLCLAVATILFVLVPLRTFPLHGERSDMLPLIVAANQRFFAGENLYHEWYTVAEHELPLTYLPALWLTFSPLVLAGADPRWLAIPAHLALVALHLRALRPALSSPWIAYLLFLALNPILFLRHEIHLYPYWLIFCAALWALLRQRWLLASGLWALAFLMRESIWPLVPFLVTFLFYTTGWRTTARALLLMATIFAITTLPLVLATPGPLWEGVVAYRGQAATRFLTNPWETVAMLASGFSLAPTFYILDIKPLLIPTQLATLAISFGLMLWRRPALPSALLLMGVAQFLVLTLNALAWDYMFAEVIFLLAFGKIAQFRKSLPALASASQKPALTPPLVGHLDRISP